MISMQGKTSRTKHILVPLQRCREPPERRPPHYQRAGLAESCLIVLFNEGELASIPPFGLFLAFKSLNPPRRAALDGFFDAFMIFGCLDVTYIGPLGPGDSG
jgi:hypothetical protein